MSIFLLIIGNKREFKSSLYVIVDFATKARKVRPKKGINLFALLPLYKSLFHMFF